MTVKSPKLITKIYLLMMLPLIFGIFVVGVSGWANKEIQFAEHYRIWTDDILNLSMKLSVTGFDVISFPEEKRPRRQWSLLYKKMVNISEKNVDLGIFAEESLKKIKTSLVRLDELYSDITVNAVLLNDRHNLERTKRITRRLLFEVNVIVTEASKLNSNALNNKSEVYPRANFLMTMVGVVSLFLFFVVLYILKQSILNPLNILKVWSHRLADGELDNRIELKQKDEIASLANDFNMMADRLQLSIKNLEVEVGERKQAEALLKDAQLLLSDANENLEVRIDERTLELEEAVLVAEKANNAKSIFLANISHELRTPMHGVLGFSRLGMDRFESASREKLKSYFEIINTSGGRLLLLLNDLLDLAKLESGKMVIKRELCSISQIINVSIAEQKISVESKNLNVIVDVCQDAQLVMCDLARMQQVVSNVLSNAIKYSFKGGEIKISAEASKMTDLPDDNTIPLNKANLESTNKSAVRLEIVDHGIGIPENELEEVFDKFIQSSKADSGSGGTGLGLAICKEIIDLHQGRIWAESNEAGTRFIILLPERR